ncbi:complement component C8 alpha chain [Cololabis saira]|uniref:complement component C8 alpha chain n=1 Tax=Cololabis saira TaxID=129043 RepID=UPI002AD28077|nr:complement component C8 alpha chain [Cololabis saira]
MGGLIHVLLGLCALHLFHSCSVSSRASRRLWTSANNRSTRAVSTLVPINCKQGGWSSWTTCNSCTDKSFRFRYLEKPSQFGGITCIDSLWGRQACPAATTQCLVDDYCGESFTCSGTGRCISQSLRCNGEADCDDFSDEDECEQFNQRDDKCSTLLPIPGAERGTQGFSILTGDFMDQVLDPKYFGGQCEYVYNGEWRKFSYDAFCESLHYNEDEKNYRKPYNYHAYRFVAEATSKGSHEYFEDMQSLLKARGSMSSFNLGFTVGVQYVKVGLSGSTESEFLSNLTRFSSQDRAFLRVWSQVQTAQFKMRSNQLMLHEDFYVALMELPELYEFGTYSRFLDTFGTHYVTEGTMGGTLEYIYVLNKRAMAESNIEVNKAQSCLGASLGISYPVNDALKVDFGVKGKACPGGHDIFQSADSSSGTVDDIVAQVKGGVTETGAGVLAIRDPDTYKKWGASLKYNPVLIEYETMPIYELVRLSTAAAHVGARGANLERAVDEYLQMFDPCRCAPCRHNGVPVLSGTSCSCICKSGYQGMACEETLRRDAVTDGSWSCWGSWSSCASGRKTRTRACSNPAPDAGGAACLGSPTQTRYC